MNTINSPLGQLARMYGALESVLRRAATNNKPMLIGDINEDPEIKDVAKSKWQARDCINNLVNKGNVQSMGSGRTKSYMWNLNAEPFTLKTKQIEGIRTQPSEVSIVKTEKIGKTITKQEYEIVLGGVQFTIGKNPITGNTRIIIEDIK